jgi:hypothetical protein
MLKLEYYKQKFQNLPSQGTEDWLKSRQYSFGGSEMASVLEKNKNQTWEELKTSKQNNRTRSDPTEWGHLFENVAKYFIRKTWGDIHEFGSIPHPFYPVCYSPDGVMVIENELVLLEIKSPIKRGVNKIPDTYQYQIQTGLNVISAKYCLFAQFRFRRCKWRTNPLNTVYDRKYHLEYRKRCKDMYPIAAGYFWWDTKQFPLKDLGVLDVMIDCMPDHHDGTPLLFINDWEHLPTTGIVLMWKLFEVVYSNIPTKKNFLHELEEQLWKKYEEMRKEVKKETAANITIN